MPVRDQSAEPFRVPCYESEFNLGSDPGPRSLSALPVRPLTGFPNGMHRGVLVCHQSDPSECPVEAVHLSQDVVALV